MFFDPVSNRATILYRDACMWPNLNSTCHQLRHHAKNKYKTSSANIETHVSRADTERRTDIVRTANGTSQQSLRYAQVSCSCNPTHPNYYVSVISIYFFIISILTRAYPQLILGDQLPRIYRDALPAHTERIVPAGRQLWSYLLRGKYSPK